MIAIFFVLALTLFSVNVQGQTVEVLTDSTFSQKISSHFWLVEFYAPWCGHCKKLNPILDKVAADIADVEGLKIGKLDATISKATATEYNVSGFPTLIYFQRGVVGKYEGPRTEEALRAFMLKMASPIVHEVADLAALDSFYSTHPIAFVLTLPVEGYIETDYWRSKFESAAKKLHLQATFVVISSSTVSAPVIEKHESGRPPVLLSKRSSSKLTTEDVEYFVSLHNVPFINYFDNHNFKKLGSLGKVLAMLAVDYASADIGELKASLDRAASGLSSSDADKFVFGFIDGVKWVKFLKQYDLEATPTLILLNLAKEEHLTVLLGEERPLTETIDSVIRGYLSGELSMKVAEQPGVLQRALKKLRSYYPWSLLCILPVIFLMVSFFTPYPEDVKPKRD